MKQRIWFGWWFKRVKSKCESAAEAVAQIVPNLRTCSKQFKVFLPTTPTLYSEDRGGKAVQSLGKWRDYASQEFWKTKWYP